MKIEPEHYKIISDYMLNAVNAIGKEKIKEHRALNLGKDIELRFAWDLWKVAENVSRNENQGINVALKFICNTLYDYMDDTHIGTALKKWVRDNEGLIL